jgi:hypothetical protein
MIANRADNAIVDGREPHDWSAEIMQHILGALKVEERKRLVGSSVPCGLEGTLGRKW